MIISYINCNINCNIIICGVIYVDLPAPNNVRATVLSHSTVEVMWDQLCDATEYTISYSTTASHITGGSVTVKGGSTTSHTLTNLERNIPITFTVQATTRDGRKSALSSEVTVITHAAGKSHSYIIIIIEEMTCYNSTAPSSPPQSIVITSTDPASLKVSWQPPMEISHSILITGYVIQYIKDGTQDIIKDIKNINGTTHTISGLVACTKYSVKVAAVNDDGTGPFSEPVVETSGEDSEFYIVCML